MESEVALEKIKMTEEEYRLGNEEHDGICMECGEIAYGVDVDAVRFMCEGCDKRAVYGLEMLMNMDLIEFTDLEGDGDETDSRD